MEIFKLSGTLLCTKMAERNVVNFCLNSDAVETFKHKSLILLFESQTYKTSHVRIIYSWLLALALVAEPYLFTVYSKTGLCGNHVLILNENRQSRSNTGPFQRVFHLYSNRVPFLTREIGPCVLARFLYWTILSFNLLGSRKCDHVSKGNKRHAVSICETTQNFSRNFHTRTNKVM